MALVTVGGFYPGFDTRPAVVPPQRRVAIDLASPIPAGLSIHAEGYVAAGAGTLQLGGRLDVAFEVAGTGVRGSVGVDALAQLSPLWFTATVTGSASLRALGRRLAGVDVRGRLTGPGPLVLHARATAEILGVDVGGSASFTLSSAGGADRTAAPLLRDAVERQLRNPANVRAEGGADPYVLVTPRDPEPGVPLVAPGAAVVWSQEAFPLGEPVEKADGRLLGRRATVLVTAGPTPTPTVTCRLPTAAFLDLTDAEVLSVPQFDERPAGLRIAAATHEGGPPHTVSTDYDTIRIPQPHTWLTSEFLYSGAVVEALRGTARPPALTAGIRPVVAVASESWAVVTNGAIDQEARSGASAHAIATRTPGATALPMAAAQAVIP